MSFEFLADPNVWLTLVTLSALEIVLGIDNLVFISIAVSKLPEEKRDVRPQVRHRRGLHHPHRAADHRWRSWRACRTTCSSCSAWASRCATWC